MKAKSKFYLWIDNEHMAPYMINIFVDKYYQNSQTKYANMLNIMECRGLNGIWQEITTEHKKYSQRSLYDQRNPEVIVD